MNDHPLSLQKRKNSVTWKSTLSPSPEAPVDTPSQTDVRVSLDTLAVLTRGGAEGRKSG